MAKAYVVAEVTVTNPESYEAYRQMATETVAQHGGLFLARGGQRDQREGADASHHAGLRTVIIEFPSLVQARSWYESAEYQKAKQIRLANSLGRLFIVEGV